MNLHGYPQVLAEYWTRPSRGGHVNIMCDHTDYTSCVIRAFSHNNDAILQHDNAAMHQLHFLRNWLEERSSEFRTLA